ncbi:MAG TPA: 2-oxoglutarate dehydrogenase complex dihydrolipoyllysine-residue succinyltransferase [Bacillota bacterium]|nr:2-oxoglutarate dehydrogenase complex dihydrolipoyllysine-residue succinyltransferase [Bacillota bacterium]
MPIELKVPEVGESITEVEIGPWLKAPGDPVKKDEPVVTLESEKATVELAAPESGTLAQILKQKGEVAKVGEVIALMGKTGGQPQPAAKAPERKAVAEPLEAKPIPAPKIEPKAAESRVMPAAQALLAEHGLRPEQIPASGPGGRLLKEDVLHYLEQTRQQPPLPAETQQGARPQRLATPAPPPAPEPATPLAGTRPTVSPPAVSGERQDEVVPMSRLRRTVAERLVEAQRNAALLTTFNEIDMTSVIALRKQYGESFQQKYQVKLGFMSFFVKACIDGLKQFPTLNAEVSGSNIVYHNYYDIGVAVGSGKGLVVPVLRNAERLSFAEIEVTIGDFGRRAKENKLKLEELQGGTFTISNGGVYGSLLSTPIVNPPQSGVLGMHAMQERPVAREGAVVIRPMMYVALTYDHRIVDGREAVSFLKRVKDVIETPTRMLMEV